MYLRPMAVAAAEVRGMYRQLEQLTGVREWSLNDHMVALGASLGELAAAVCRYATDIPDEQTTAPMLGRPMLERAELERALAVCVWRTLMIGRPLGAEIPAQSADPAPTPALAALGKVTAAVGELAATVGEVTGARLPDDEVTSSRPEPVAACLQALAVLAAAVQIDLEKAFYATVENLRETAASQLPADVESSAQAPESVE
jgi:hypothetical protein